MNFLSLNVCGLISKLNCPAFISLINRYEIIGLQETKTDDIDTCTIDIPGYTVFLNNRSCSSRNRSGGIALVVKNDIVPYVKIHEKINDLILLFSVSSALNSASNVKEDLICGIVYIPPCGSKYAVEDPFLEKQEVLLKYGSDANNFLLFGDFNSRTGILADYVHMDTFMCNRLGIEELDEENSYILNLFEKCQIPLTRKNADNTINTYGRSMIDFCKNINVFILNSRLSDEQLRPKLTCKDSSTVDYFIASATIFEFIKDFKVNEFSNLYSDAHCSIALSLNVQLGAYEKPVKAVSHDQPKMPKLWDANNTELFLENFDIPRVAEIESKLDQLLEKGTASICKDSIDDIIDSIGSLFVSCSRDTFGYKQIKKKNSPSKFKPWFNRDCISTRNLYHKVRKKYNQHKNSYYKNLLKIVSKKYKKILLKSTVTIIKTRKFKNLEI